MKKNVLVDLMANEKLRKEVTKRLGGFAPVFGEDIDRFPLWGKFHTQLIEEILDYRPDGSEMNTPYSEEEYAEFTNKAIQFTSASLVDKKVPYHDFNHNLSVGNDIAVMDEKLEEIIGEPVYDEVVKQSSLTAGLVHDAFHHGESARVGERGNMHRPELGKEGEVTVEEVSAFESDRFLATSKYSIPARLFNTAMINATHRKARPLSYHFAKIRNVRMFL